MSKDTLKELKIDVNLNVDNNSDVKVNLKKFLEETEVAAATEAALKPLIEDIKNDSRFDERLESTVNKAHVTELLKVMKTKLDTEGYTDVYKKYGQTITFAVQSALRIMKFDLPIHNIDGQYGVETSNAVAAFQKWKGLTPDGDAGPVTIAKMIEVTLDAQYDGSIAPVVKLGAAVGGVGGNKKEALDSGDTKSITQENVVSKENKYSSVSGYESFVETLKNNDTRNGISEWINKQRNTVLAGYGYQLADFKKTDSNNGIDIVVYNPLNIRNRITIGTIYEEDYKKTGYQLNTESIQNKVLEFMKLHHTGIKQNIENQQRENTRIALDRKQFAKYAQELLPQIRGTEYTLSALYGVNDSRVNDIRYQKFFKTFNNNTLVMEKHHNYTTMSQTNEGNIIKFSFDQSGLFDSKWVDNLTCNANDILSNGVFDKEKRKNVVKSKIDQIIIDHYT